MMFRGVAVTIACTDLRRSAAFYEQVLGAVRLPGDGQGCPLFRLGSLVLSLMPNAAERSPASFPTHAMPVLWLEVDDLTAAHGQLSDAGAEIIEPPNGTSMLVGDPDGIVIEVWQSEPRL